jgi:hypothetical protein
MMPRQASNAKQVSSLGETPAEARRRMRSSGGVEAKATPPLGEEVTGPLQPKHIAAIREADEGFGGGPTEGATVEEAGDTADPPSPAKAMQVIRQLSQDKLQLRTELDAALAKLNRYERKFGELD